MTVATPVVTVGTFSVTFPTPVVTVAAPVVTVGTFSVTVPTPVVTDATRVVTVGTTVCSLLPAPGSFPLSGEDSARDVPD